MTKHQQESQQRVCTGLAPVSLLALAHGKRTVVGMLIALRSMLIHAFSAKVTAKLSIFLQ